MYGSIEALEVEGAEAEFHATSAAGSHLVRWMLGHESSLPGAVVSSLRPDDVFLDGGPNLGQYSYVSTNRMATGKVASVEPYPPNARQL